MLCKKFGCTLSTDVCLKRQEKAQKQGESACAFVESLIFCISCIQGEKIKRTSSMRITDLDVIKLRKETIKTLLAKKDYRMFKIKRIELKKVERIKKLQLKKRG